MASRRGNAKSSSAGYSAILDDESVHQAGALCFAMCRSGPCPTKLCGFRMPLLMSTGQCPLTYSRSAMWVAAPRFDGAHERARLGAHTPTLF